MINDAVKQIEELRTKILKHFDELVYDGKFIQLRNEYIAADFPEWLEMEDELIDIVENCESPVSLFFYYHNFLELIFLDKVSKKDIDTYCIDENILTTFMSSKYFDEILINDASIIYILHNRFKTSKKLLNYLERNYDFHDLIASDNPKEDQLIVRKTNGGTNV